MNTVKNNQTDRSESRFLARKKQHIALALLIATVAVINTMWIRQDESRMIKSDAYDFLTQLLLFIDAFDLNTFADPWPLLDRLSVGGRPPLYQLLTIPFVLVFGRSEDAALAVNLVFLVILVLSTYGIGRLVSNGTAGLLGAFFVVSYPPIIHLSRTYLPHAALPACTALSLYLALLIKNQPSLRYAWFYCASLAFGMLIHPYFIWFAVPPTILVVYISLFCSHPKRPINLKQAPTWLLEKVRDRFVIVGLLPGALFALGLILAWYMTIGYRLFGVVKFIDESRAGTTHMHGFPEVESTFWRWTQTTPSAISYIFTLLLIGGVVSAIVRRRRPALILAFTLIATYAIWSFRGTPRAWWYFASVLPIAASVTAVGIADLRRNWLSRTLIVGAVALGAFNFSVVTWGVQPWSRPLAIAMGSPLGSACRRPMTTVFCPTPPQVERWPARDILRTVLSDSECQKGQRCWLLTTGDIWLGRLRYYLIRDRAQNRLALSHQEARRIAPAYDFKKLLNSNYLVYPDPQPPHMGRPYGRVTARFLQSPPAAFSSAHRTVATFECPNGQLKLVKRVKPLTIEEAEASIEAIDLSDEDKLQGPQVLSELYRTSGQHEEVVTLLKEALNVKPNDLSAHEKLAEAYRRTGNTDAAIAEFETAIAKFPGAAKPRYMLAEIFRSLGQFDRAMTLYREAFEIKPGYITARVDLSETYRKAGNIDAAIAELETAISLFPDAAKPRYSLAEIFRTSGQFDRATSLYQETLEIKPEHLASRVRLAETYRQIGNTDAAITELETAIIHAPGKAWPRRVLAETYRGLGQLDRAIINFQEAIRILPKDVWPRIRLSELYREIGNIDAAIAELETVITLAPDKPLIRRKLATTYLSAGRKTEAIAFYERILQIQPEDDDARKALYRLTNPPSSE